ncbi:MAG TPA: MliC family protein [Wenzhouxiangella sp.]|nr:MliC family protein [Wenzhouxiangella sp.]
MKKFLTRSAAVFAILAVFSPPVPAEVSLSIAFGLDEATATTLSYECDDGERFAVHYYNSGSNVLALVPVDGEQRVFVNVVSASGARYVAGQYEWWTKGQNAMLTDVIEDTIRHECVVSAQ